jgi:hypothetical protein
METETKPTLPTIHLNGTSPKDLLDGYRNAMDAVGAAQAALCKIEFNARDYYVVPGSWEAARAEMKVRFEALEKIYVELTEIATHCCDAVAEREARRQETERRFA